MCTAGDIRHDYDLVHRKLCTDRAVGRLRERYQLFEAPLWFCSEHPVLWPLAAIDIPLGVVISDSLFLGDVVLIVRSTGALRGWEVCPWRSPPG